MEKLFSYLFQIILSGVYLKSELIIFKWGENLSPISDKLPCISWNTGSRAAKHSSLALWWNSDDFTFLKFLSIFLRSKDMIFLMPVLIALNLWNRKHKVLDSDICPLKSSVFSCVGQCSNEFSPFYANRMNFFQILLLLSNFLKYRNFFQPSYRIMDFDFRKISIFWQVSKWT